MKKIIISGKYIDPVDFERLENGAPLSVVLLPKLAEMSEADIKTLHKESVDADLVIMGMFGSNPAKLSEIGLQKISAPKAYWSFDSHHQWSNELQIQHLFDKLFISHSPYRKYFPADKTEWLPCCFVRYGTKDLLRLIADDQHASVRKLDLAFPHKQYRIGSRNNLANSIKSKLTGKNLRIHFGPIESGESYMRLIQSARVVLNISLMDDLNIRNFEAWAFNRLMLANPTPDHALLGELGQAVVFFKRNLNDFEQRLDYALQLSSDSTINTAPYVFNGHMQVHRYTEILNSILGTKYTVRNVSIPDNEEPELPTIQYPPAKPYRFNGHGNNIGVIALSHKTIQPAPHFCARRLQIEDNIGEAIHVHWRNFRLDFSTNDFRALSEGMKAALFALGPKRLPVSPTAKLKLSPAYSQALGSLKNSIIDARLENMQLDDLVALVYTKRDGGSEWESKSLTESPSYKYLQGEHRKYDQYHKRIGDFKEHNKAFFEDLIHSMLVNGYPYDDEFITIHGDEPYIRDGQHRACMLRYFFGNIKVPILRLQFKENTSWRMGLSQNEIQKNLSLLEETKSLDSFLYLYTKARSYPLEIAIADQIDSDVLKLLAALLRNRKHKLHVLLGPDNDKLQNLSDKLVEFIKLGVHIHPVTGKISHVLQKWQTPVDLFIIESELEYNESWSLFEDTLATNGLLVVNKKLYKNDISYAKHNIINYLWKSNQRSRRNSTLNPKIRAANDKDIGKILLVRTDSIGDHIIASPILHCLNKIFPNAEIDFLCQSHITELYDHCPYINETIPFKIKEVQNNQKELDKIIHYLNNKKYDLAINCAFSRDYISDILTLGARATKTITFTGDLSNINSDHHAFFNSKYSRLIESSEGVELFKYKELLHALGVKKIDNFAPTMWLSPEDKKWAESLLHKQEAAKYIAIFVGAKHYHKRYPHLGKALERYTDYTAIVLGGEDAIESQEIFCKEFPGRAIKLAGKTTIRQMAAVIKNCEFYAGMDSSGAHIACAMNIPNIVILGGGHYGRFLPYSPLTSVVVLPLSCYQCNWKCPYPKAHCVDGIAPEVVEWAIKQHLHTSSDKPRVIMQNHNMWKSEKGLPSWQGALGILPDTEVLPAPLAALNIDKNS